MTTTTPAQFGFAASSKQSVNRVARRPSRWMVCAATLLAATGSAAESAPNTLPPNPLVRVVTVTQDGLREQGADLRKATLRVLQRAASFKPDIACLPETFTASEAEPVPGPTTDMLSDWAKANNCWVICPILVRTEERIFNSAVLIDRAGNVAGRYDKIHPTEIELARSVCPGQAYPPTFDTDFGRIGIQICFDVNWHDQWRHLKTQGAELLFFPSAYPAHRQIRTLAWLNQCFVVTATKSRPAGIYDISGDTITRTGRFQRWAGAVIPLHKRMFEIDFHIGKMREIQAKYGERVSVQWYHDDDLVSLASLDPELTVQQLIQEFDLTPHTEYIARAQSAQDKQRQARPTSE